MLDIHPPHESAHSWRDFLIHIATICVGLLIAIGLEQTVEFFHHHHQVTETREALLAERAINRQVTANDTILFRREAAALENNLLVLAALRKHPGMPRADLPGILTWHSDLQTALPHTAWITAEQTGVTGLMPIVEVRQDADLYEHLEHVGSGADDVWSGLNGIRAVTVNQPDPSLWSPAQIDTVTNLTTAQIVRLYSFGAMLVILHQDYPDFASGFNNADIKPLINMQEGESTPDAADPLSKTIERIDAAGKFRDYFPQADGTQR